MKKLSASLFALVSMMFTPLAFAQAIPAQCVVSYPANNA